MSDKVNVDTENNMVNIAYDNNKDGQPSAKLSISVGEAFQEAFNKGAKLEGVKVVEVKFELTRLKVSLDTDKDGEKLLELEVDLAELIDETGILSNG